jgi:hypothetical protein
MCLVRFRSPRRVIEIVSMVCFAHTNTTWLWSLGVNVCSLLDSMIVCVLLRVVLMRWLVRRSTSSDEAMDGYFILNMSKFPLNRTGLFPYYHPSLRAYYTFDDAPGVMVYDSSVNENNGVINGVCCFVCVCVCVCL